MALGGCLTCVKYLLFIFNFLFWLAGCVLLGMGIWLVVDNKTFEGIEGTIALLDRGRDSIGGYGLIIIGSIIMLVGFFGCCGAIRESQCLLVTFFICLFIIFGVLLGIGIFFIVSTPEKIEETYREKYKKLVEASQEGGSLAKEHLETIHAQFKCCGYKHGSVDFGTSAKPAGCMPDPLRLCPKAEYEKVKNGSVILAGVSIGIGVVLLLGMIFSMMLCCAIRDSV